MIYFQFSWLLVVLLFISSQNACAARKRKGKPKFSLPKININIHHNNIHIG
ncbi:uncharacterized protein LOC26526183 [Drosophila erecta]|uniref:uncharacterized protein LOC26526183 n=1 Tax=Drosophila erecta TaxID=7220 RepID=UPI000732AA03|nr:uncharacterized protein LOC26526183 [Drosophila erecta]KQS52026.1 uncharacterized protein Dere_GG26359 [Drosophila erecta]